MIALFYVKYKKNLLDIKHDLLDNIKIVLNGNNMIGYPSLKEIRDRAEVYDTKFQWLK